MSPASGEVASSLYGAFRLARFDPSGLNYFNISLNGFWNSFSPRSSSRPCSGC